MRPIIFSDFDGTISQLDVTDLVLTQLAHPSWREVEQEWARGLIGSRECLERQMALVSASTKELNALVDTVPIDPHFAKFHRFLMRHAFPFYVVSDGFDLFIRRVLKNAGLNGPLRNGTHLFSSALKGRGGRVEPSFPHAGPPCQHDCATCKVEIIRQRRRAGSAVIFIGDGLSDRFAAQSADIVFAKRQLLAYCRENAIACRPFETFADIEAELATMLESDGDYPGSAQWSRPKTNLNTESAKASAASVLKSFRD
ncbi:MAG TPA: MtnX-like HAD-IB family phosphatase [Terriglobia bacterium]|nr:MtnX-like HAD-IB family phosphatase [Terriglobia bacterium]